MIKFNGLNYKNGSGDRYLFGDFLNGGGSGKGINYWYLSYYFGNGWGDGCYFGYGKGDGESYKLLKQEFLKNND